jgi:hypothetical protein
MTKAIDTKQELMRQHNLDYNSALHLLTMARIKTE